MSARRGEAGYSLVFAVAVLAAFSLLVSAMLGLSGSLSLQTRASQEVTRGRNAADAAVEFGVERIVEDGAAATFGTSASYAVPGTIDGDTTDVTVKNVSVTFITISPATATATVNQAVVFTVTARSGGVVIPFAPVWSVTCTGPTATITQAGVFVATAGTGTCAVRVEVYNVVATATVGV